MTLPSKAGKHLHLRRLKETSETQICNQSHARPCIVLLDKPLGVIKGLFLMKFLDKKLEQMGLNQLGHKDVPEPTST